MHSRPNIEGKANLESRVISLFICIHKFSLKTKELALNPSQHMQKILKANKKAKSDPLQHTHKRKGEFRI